MSQVANNVIPPVLVSFNLMDFYKGVPFMQEYIILSSSEPDWSVFLASNIRDPISLYWNNVTNTYSGYNDPLFHYL